MGILSPAPTVLGALSLTAAVELVCAVHLCLCVGLLSNVSSEHSATIAGVELSPILQCATGAWCLLGIPMIIHGGIGAIYHVETHLNTYFTYLVGTTAWAVAFVVIFAKEGNACSTLQPKGDEQNAQASFACGVSNGMVIFWMLVLVGILSGWTYLAWSLKDYAKKRLEQELIRYQEPWEMIQALADDAAEEEAKALAATMSSDETALHHGQQQATMPLGNFAGHQATGYGGLQSGGYFAGQQGPPAGYGFGAAQGPPMATPQAMMAPQAAF